MIYPWCDCFYEYVIMLFWISLLAAGMCLCLLIFLALSPGMQHTEVQTEDLAHSIKLKPLLPWVAVLSKLVSPFLTWKYRLRLKLLISQSGLIGQLSVSHIAGLQCLAALIVTLIGFLLFKILLSMSWLMSCILVAIGFLLGVYWPVAWLKGQVAHRKRVILKGFPFVLDMTTLCVESGMNLHGALIQTAQSIPDGPLRDEIRYALSEMRTGVSRSDALRDMAERSGLVELKQWVSSINQTESLGMGLGPMLRAQADQRRNERFLRAEKLALEAPVKMLLPLVLCIFPCTFIVLAFPIGMKLMNAGL